MRIAAAAERLTRAWFAPAPAERLAALRIAIGGFATAWLIARLPELATIARAPASQFAAVGVIRVLRAPLPPGAVIAIAVATIALCAACTLGAAYRITAPLAALGALWTMSYRSSWGMVFHTENLLVLHLLALAVAPAADAWALGRRAAGDRGAGYGWAIRLLAALTCATYLVAGIAKLRLSGLHWLDGAQLAHQIAIDDLRKALLGGATAPLAAPLVAHPAALAIASIGTLVIELGAPLALLGGRVARGWAAAAWAFHAGVVLAMNVWFPYPLCGVAFLPLFAAERLIDVPLRGWRSRAIPAA
ncbi:MAG TPA: HTTM domain-containing protein [Kofleriaceae bacterium]|nr:HTTM domain-containing protein [Kofleriaceae bacterium]